MPAARPRTICIIVWSTATRRPRGRGRRTLAVHDWLLRRLLAFDAGADNNADGEPDDEADADGPR